MTEKSPFTILITKDGMGDADQELRHKLIGTYLTLLNESGYLPSVIAFYTEGVKLLVEGSPVLEQLRALDEKGVRLIACGTCLSHYELFHQIEVGIVGGMTDIIEAQWRADKVITL
jgi:intracellular sulfur oxidation DsrE/DsrF family protein